MNKYLKLAILTSLMLNSPMAMEQQQDLVMHENNQIVKLERNQLLAACEELGFNLEDKTTKKIETEMLGIDSITLYEADGENKYLSLIQLIQGGCLSNLQTLKMYCGNQVDGIDGFVNNLAQAIKVSHIKLKELRFSGHVITNQGMRTLAQTDWSQMKVLTFSKCRISCNGERYLATAIKGGLTPALEYLDISESDIPSEGVSAIVDAVRAARERGKLTQLELLCFNKDERLKFADFPQ